MSLKRFIILAVISIIINLASLINAGFGLWSLVLLIFAIFQFKFRDADRPANDKKVYGFIQIFMLAILTFLSTGIALAVTYSLGLLIYDRLSQIFVICLIAAIIGIVLYYYLLVRLIREAIAIFKQGRLAK